MYAAVMGKAALLGLFLAASVWSQDKGDAPRKAPESSHQTCPTGAICFMGEVHEGETFRKDLNDSLEFVLRIPGGFDVISRSADPGCKLSSWVANPPLQAHHATEIDAAYDWTAEDEVRATPRDFRFVTSCEDFQALFDLSQQDAGKYFEKLPSLAKGQGRLWITDSKVTHARDISVAGHGAIEWLKFAVEIVLPGPSK